MGGKFIKISRPNSVHIGSLPIPIAPHPWRYNGPETPDSLYFYSTNRGLFGLKKLTSLKCHHLSTCMTWLRQYTSFAHITVYVPGDQGQMHIHRSDKCRTSSTLNASLNFPLLMQNYFCQYFNFSREGWNQRKSDTQENCCQQTDDYIP